MFIFHDALFYRHNLLPWSKCIVAFKEDAQPSSNLIFILPFDLRLRGAFPPSSFHLLCSYNTRFHHILPYCTLALFYPSQVQLPFLSIGLSREHMIPLTRLYQIRAAFSGLKAHTLMHTWLKAILHTYTARLKANLSSL